MSNVTALDKQVVRVKGKYFTDLVNAGIDTRELDRALTLLGIELVIDSQPRNEVES